MDLSKAIRTAVDTGKVSLGIDGSLKRALAADAKLIVVASNCPVERKADLQHYAKLSGVPCVDFVGTSVELGIVCGKPFPVSALSVIEEGNSDILSAGETA